MRFPAGTVFIVLLEDDGEVSVDSVWRREDDARGRLRACFLDTVRWMNHNKADWRWEREGLKCYHEFLPYGIEIVKEKIEEV